MAEEKRNPLTAFIEEKLVPISTGFAQNAYIRCIGSGSKSLMAIIMIGAIFNLFNSIAWEPYQNLITSLGISGFLTVVYNASMNFMGLFMVFSVAFQGAKIWDHAELSFNNGLLALMAYLILIPYGVDEAGNSIILLDYLGSHGVFLAFIVGIMVTKINIFNM